MAPDSPAPSSSSRFCSFHPALNCVTPGAPTSSAYAGIGTAGHRVPGTISFQRKGFQAQRGLRDKRPSVHPLVPSPSLLKQPSFMQLPHPLLPPPAVHCLLSGRLYARLVCGAERRLSVVLRCSPPFTLSREDQAWGLEEGWGLR
jgi:hypothetical protein